MDSVAVGNTAIYKGIDINFSGNLDLLTPHDVTLAQSSWLAASDLLAIGHGIAAAIDIDAPL